MTNSTRTIVDLIRHGEPVGGKKYRGHQNDPLSDKGWMQMRDAIGDHKPWDIIVSSPLIRCAAFAKEIAERHQLTVEYQDLIKEIGWGDWEGKTPAEINAKDSQTIARTISDPENHRPSNAEGIQDFHRRVTEAWQDIVERHFNKHVLVVAHAGVIRAILTTILNTPAENMFRIHVANASITRIHVDYVDSTPLPKLIFHGGQL